MNASAAQDQDSQRAQLQWRIAQALKIPDYPAAKDAIDQMVGLDQSAAPVNRLGVTEIFAPLEPIKWLLKPLDLCPGAPALVAGYGFSGKTVALQALAVAIASGQPAWGTYNVNRARVLHIDYEQGARLTRERYQRLAAGMMVTPDELEGRLELISMPTAYLDAANMESVLLELCAGVDLVIVDSLRAAAPTLDENSSEIRKVLDMMTRVSESTRACFVVIHHARKPNQNATGGAKMAIRGSGALFDACGSVLVFEGVKGKPVRVAHEKARVTGITAADIELTISDVDMDGNPRAGLMVTAEAVAPREQQDAGRAMDAERQRIVAHLEQHGFAAGKTALAKRLGGDRTLFYAAINELIGDGTVLLEGTYHRPRLVLRTLAGEPEGS